MQVTHLLNKTARWTRNEPTMDHGRATEVLTEINPALLCRKQIAGYSDKTVAGDEKSVATHVLFTEPGVGLVRNDWLFIDGIRYKVLASMPPSKPHHDKYQLQEQQLQQPA
jgi:hypothetical protein